MDLPRKSALVFMILLKQLTEVMLSKQVEDPLLEATKYLKLLQSNSANSLETHILSFEANMRKQKILLAFQVNL